MRASVGGWSLLNIFIVFFIIVAFMLTATVMYYKGYKVNSAIIKSLEMYEGYNELSAADISRRLGALGYREAGKGQCVMSNGSYICEGDDGRYEFTLTCSQDSRNHGDSKVRNNYVSYKVKTYIYIDLPLGVGTIKLPVTARTNAIYKFNDANAVGCENV